METGEAGGEEKQQRVWHMAYGVRGAWLHEFLPSPVPSRFTRVSIVYVATSSFSWFVTFTSHATTPWGMPSGGVSLAVFDLQVSFAWIVSPAWTGFVKRRFSSP